MCRLPLHLQSLWPSQYPDSAGQSLFCVHPQPMPAMHVGPKAVGQAAQLIAGPLSGQKPLTCGPMHAWKHWSSVFPATQTPSVEQQPPLHGVVAVEPGQLSSEMLSSQQRVAQIPPWKKPRLHGRPDPGWHPQASPEGQSVATTHVHIPLVHAPVAQSPSTEHFLP
jgi:hypothetical protein